MKQKYYNLIIFRHTCIFSYLLTLCCFSSMVSWSSGGLTSRRQVKVRFFWEGSIGGQPTELTGSNMWLNLSQHRNITILQVLSYRKHYQVLNFPSQRLVPDKTICQDNPYLFTPRRVGIYIISNTPRSKKLQQSFSSLSSDEYRQLSAKQLIVTSLPKVFQRLQPTNHYICNTRCNHYILQF